jgi:hypothetical protein
MSQNRLLYDACQFKKYVKETEYTGKYSLFPGKFVHDAKCRIELGVNSGKENSRNGLGVSIPNGNLVDLESDLLGVTRANSNCPTNKYQPKCSKVGQYAKSGLPCGAPWQQPTMRHAKTCNIIKYKKRSHGKQFNTNTTCV